MEDPFFWQSCGEIQVINFSMHLILPAVFLLSHPPPCALTLSGVRTALPQTRRANYPLTHPYRRHGPSHVHRFRTCLRQAAAPSCVHSLGFRPREWTCTGPWGLWDGGEEGWEVRVEGAMSRTSIDGPWTSPGSPVQSAPPGLHHFLGEVREGVPSGSSRTSHLPPLGWFQPTPWPHQTPIQLPFVNETFRPALATSPSDNFLLALITWFF